MTRWPDWPGWAGSPASRFAGRLVAVTGSVGKTTTKEMLRGALAAHGATHAAEASYNNHWGRAADAGSDCPRDARLLRRSKSA